jgi:hypothetical protein
MDRICFESFVEQQVEEHCIFAMDAVDVKSWMVVFVLMFGVWKWVEQMMVGMGWRVCFSTLLHTIALARLIPFDA